LAQTVVPSSYQLQLGRKVSGNVASLGFDDGDPLVLAKFFVPDFFSPWVRLDTTGFTNVLTPHSLKLIVKSKQDVAGVFRQKLFFKNFVTNSYELLWQGSMSMNYGVMVVESGGDLSRFVNQADGKLTARMEAWQDGPTVDFYPSFSYEVVTWQVTP